MAWPEGEDAHWHPDLWLADRVLGPVLKEEADALTQWRDEGGHALLHHLNAVFGYKEVQILRRELLRF